MITITLRRIMARRPCYDPIEKGIFEKNHDFDEPISFQWLAERIPPGDVVWCFSQLPAEHNALKRHFAVDCAERVRHLMADERSINALTVARRHALGEIGELELRLAYDAAWAACETARDAARGGPPWAKVFEPVWEDCEPASVVACDAAWDAACRDVAVIWDTARDAARAAELRWQVQRILEITETGEWSPVGETKE